MCDCELPSAFYETWRMARREHVCCECQLPIDIGSRYQYVSGIWDHMPSSYKTCARCVEARDWLSGRLTSGDNCVAFGRLVESLVEEANQYGWQYNSDGSHRVTTNMEDWLGDPAVVGWAAGLVYRVELS